MSSSARDAFFGSFPGIGLLMKWMTWARMGRFAHGCRRMAGLRAGQSQGLGGAMGDALCLVAPLDHQFARNIDRARISGVEKKHGCPGAGVEATLAVLPEEIAHRDGYIAEIDVHRTRIRALVAYGAMICDIAELVEMLQRDAAPRLLFVEEGLDQQAGGEYLVARAVEQVGARHMGCANRFAFAAAQAVLDRIGDRAHVGVFEDQAFRTEQRKARRVGIAQIGRSFTVRAAACPC